MSSTAETDPQSRPRIVAFQHGLEQLGWATGRNLRIDFRWNIGGDVALAREITSLEPDAILVQSNPGVASVTSVLALLHVETAAHANFLRTAQSAAPSLGVTLTAASVHNATEIQTAMTEFSGRVNSGLLVMPHPVYGIDLVDLYRRAATYVDRILRGVKPRELPVQAPSKFEMVINLKSAKALDLTIPPTLLGPRGRGDRMNWTLPNVLWTAPPPARTCHGCGHC